MNEPVSGAAPARETEPNPIRVLVVEDMSRVRAALCRLVSYSPGLTLAGEAADGEAALKAAAATRPDVILMDVQMPNLDGISAAREIAAVAPQARVLILTTFDDDDYLRNALDAGAAGFILKNAAPEEIVRAIENVHAGGGALAPEVTSRVLDAFARRPDERQRISPPLPGGVVLSERELDVLRLIARGYSNQEIAERLMLSAETVKTYVSRMLAKLGLRDRTQLAVLGVETGLVR